MGSRCGTGEDFLGGSYIMSFFFPTFSFSSSFLTDDFFASLVFSSDSACDGLLRPERKAPLGLHRGVCGRDPALLDGRLHYGVFVFCLCLSVCVCESESE